MGEGMERKESYSVISTHAPLVSLVLNYNTLKAERLFSTLKYSQRTDLTDETEGFGGRKIFPPSHLMTGNFSSSIGTSIFSMVTLPPHVTANPACRKWVLITFTQQQAQQAHRATPKPGDYAPSRHPIWITIWIGLCHLPAWLKGQEGEETEGNLHRHHLLAPAQDSQMPKAKQSWAQSQLNISFTALLQLKADGAILNDKYFPENFLPSSPHYKGPTLCLHNKAKPAVHSWVGEGALLLSDLWARGWKCLGCLAGRKKKKQKDGDKRSHNLSAWLRSAIENVQRQHSILPCTNCSVESTIAALTDLKGQLSPPPGRQQSIATLNIHYWATPNHTLHWAAPCNAANGCLCFSRRL